MRAEDEGKKEMESLIEDAKWNMYAERWSTAENDLERAKNLAVSLHDKAKIDEILALLEKCGKREKVEL